MQSYDAVFFVLRRFKPVGVLSDTLTGFLRLKTPLRASEEVISGCRCASRFRSMLGLAALRAAGSGLESGYSRGRACPISGSDTLSRKNSVSELSPVYRVVRASG